MFPLVPYHALPRLHAVVKDDCRRPIPASSRPGGRSFPPILRQMKDPAYHVKRQLPDPSPGASEGDPHLRRRARCRRLDRSLRRGRPRRGRRHPLRPRQEDLRPLPRRRGRPLRHRRHLHPRQHPSRRRPGEGQDHRVPQAQRPLQPRDGSPARDAGLPRARHLSRRGAQGAALPQRRPGRRRRRARPEDATACASSATAASPPSSRSLSWSPMDAVRSDRLHPRRLSAVRHPRLRGDPLPRFRHPGALRRGLGGAARLRSGGPEPGAPGAATTTPSPATRPTKRMLRFNVRIATPPPGPGLPAGRGLQLRLQPQAGRHRHGDRSLRRLPHQADPARNGLSSAAAPAWPRCAPTSPISSRPKAPPARSASGTGPARGRKSSTRTTSRALPERHPNFAFHLALSSPLPEDNWTGHRGFIHEVVLEQYLTPGRQPQGRRILPLRAADDDQGLQPRCWPSSACPPSQIAYDEF